MNNHTDPADAILERQLATLRAMPIPEGPSSQTRSQTLEMLQRPTLRRSRREAWQLFLENLVMLSHKPFVRLAAIAVVCGVAYWSLFSASGPTMAFADVVSKFKDARTLTYTMTATTATGQSVTSKLYYADDAMRIETGDDSITINKGDQSLLLFPRMKKATRLTVPNQPARPASSATAQLEALRQLSLTDAAPVGEKQIDGVSAKGFKTTFAGSPAIIWADAKTAMPLRLETEFMAGGQAMKMVMDHFKIDPSLDASLFSTEVPAEYTLTTTTLKLPVLGNVEDEVAKLLGSYAKASGGALPGSLTDWADFSRVTKSGADLDIMTRVGGVSGKLFSLPNGYTYAGKGVRMGDKNTLIFWVHPAANMKSVRGVYADLHVADVPVEALAAK